MRAKYQQLFSFHSPMPFFNFLLSTKHTGKTPKPLARNILPYCPEVLLLQVAWKLDSKFVVLTSTSTLCSSRILTSTLITTLILILLQLQLQFQLLVDQVSLLARLGLSLAVTIIQPLKYAFCNVNTTPIKIIKFHISVNIALRYLTVIEIVKFEHF